MDQNQMNRAAQPQRQAASGGQGAAQQRPAQGMPQRTAAPGAQRPAQGMPQRTAAPGAQRPVQGASGTPQQRPAQGMPQRAAAPGAQQRPAQGAQGMPQRAAAPGAQGMSDAQAGVEKQLIVRMFVPDMPLLKATAKQLSGMPNVKLGLYGQSGEVLVVIAARARTAAAAMELTENAAAQLEAAMGDSVYARGKAPLAAVTVGEMQQDEATMAAPDDETGRLLETELQSVHGADKVFDFGQNSFRNVRMADKIADAALMDDEESTDPIQLSADRSYAARKCTKTDFGVSIATVGGKMVCAAVTYGKTVYVRCIRSAPDAEKAAALSIFDMIRRLTLGLDIPYARAFKAGQEIDWNEPQQQKAEGKSGKGGKKGGKNIIVPLVVLIVVALALGVAIWYVVSTFIIKDEGSLPAGNGTSVSDSMPAGTSGAGDAGTADDGAATTPDASAASVPQPVDSGAPVVHPFA